MVDISSYSIPIYENATSDFFALTPVVRKARMNRTPGKIPVVKEQADSLSTFL